MAVLLLLLLGAFLFLVLRFLAILWTIYQGRNCTCTAKGGQEDAVGIRRNIRRSKPASTLIVLGSGGHTTEILTLTKHLHRTRYAPVTYVKAETDSTSVQRLEQMHPWTTAASSDAAGATMVHNLPRSREVGQSYWTSIGTTLRAQIHALWLVGRTRPDLIICNGPGTCLPVCVAGFLFRILCLAECRVVFIESYCRVQTLSLTGKLLYPWADVFVVHWKELHHKYPRSHLVSTFVRD